MKADFVKRARINETMEQETSVYRPFDPHDIADFILNHDSPLAEPESRHESTEKSFVFGDKSIQDNEISNVGTQPLDRDDHQEIVDEASDEFNQVGASEFTLEEIEIKSNLEAALSSVHPQLEETLTNVRATTKTLFNAIEKYMKEIESIEIDYSRCRASLRKEACRLVEVAPDVSRVTDCFLNMKQVSNLSK